MTLARLRGWLLAVLAFGLAGTFVELLLLAHYEEAWQLSPLVLIGAAAVALACHQTRPSAATVRAIQFVMLLFVASGAAGIALHVRGAAAFQLEIDPAMARWALVKKTMRAQSPPALACGQGSRSSACSPRTVARSGSPAGPACRRPAPRRGVETVAPRPVATGRSAPRR